VQGKFRQGGRVCYDAPVRYPAYLEIGPLGHTIAYVFALPGLTVRGRKADGALATLPDAVDAERARLRAAAREVPEGPVEIAESERVTVTSDVAGGVSSALFQYELRPTRDEDVALALDRMGLAREEIGRVDAPSAEALRALADGEWWLLSRLGTRPFADLPEEPLARLDTVRALTVERFAQLLPGDRERHAVFAGEQWTTRKVLRRLACLSRDAALAIGALPATRG
jgi:hypothetical protein